MRLAGTRLGGLKLAYPTVHHDGRGFFLETFREDEWAESGISGPFVQDNQSRSARGTLRGLHFQVSPGQSKLVRVARGSIYDVVVDLRPDSPTFGQYEAFTLDDLDHGQLFVPPGFAHGFQVLSPTADVVYRVGSYYDPTAERGLAWNDPDLAIPWPNLRPRLSARDRTNPGLSELFATVHPR
jgi:dTDP-4-dehydrorhamnose 3,5-epimerase